MCLPVPAHLREAQVVDFTIMQGIERNGRGERIRTSDPLVPNQVRYQTALRPELNAESMPVESAFRGVRAVGDAGDRSTD